MPPMRRLWLSIEHWFGRHIGVILFVAYLLLCLVAPMFWREAVDIAPTYYP
jgi:hypothetical protein